MGILGRLKRRLLRRLANELEAEQERIRPRPRAVLGAGAVVAPEAVIENLSPREEAVTIGEQTFVRGRLMVYPNAGSIRIGSWCYIGSRTEIWAMTEMTIGNRVLIAHNCTILDSSGHSRNAAERHAHFRAIVTTGHPKTWEELPGISVAPTVIEDDVWIGAGVIVMPGVRIGARSIIAAGSVVSADVPADTIFWNQPNAQSVPNFS